jgi:phage gp36-like protein
MYCNQTDIISIIPEKELINLTQDNPAQSQTVNEDILNENIKLSSEIIDGYVKGKYAVPLSNTPEIIRAIAVDITVYRLYSRRPQKMNDTIKDRYNNALNLLKEVQKGNITLSVQTETGETVELKNITVRSNKNAYSKQFTDRFLAGY